MGIDPGTTHLGLAWTGKDTVWAAEVFLQRDRDAVERMRHLYFTLCSLDLPLWDDQQARKQVVIEGAAFGERYRQVELAEARATLVWWVSGFASAKIVPPISIRKTVFGSVKVRAHDYWDNSEIENDALAALSCLYYAATLEVKDVEK